MEVVVFPASGEPVKCRCATTSNSFNTIATMEESKTRDGGGKAGGGGEAGGDDITEQQVISTYRSMLGDVSQMRRKIGELEQEMSEHQ